MSRKLLLGAFVLLIANVAHAQNADLPPPFSANGARAVSITGNSDGSATVRYADGSQFTAIRMTAVDIAAFRNIIKTMAQKPQ